MSVLLGQGLEGRRVLIAGATGGIGRAMAVLFAEVGARVGALDLDADRVNALVDELPGDGHLAIPENLRDTDAGRRAVARVEDLHALVNAAAVLTRRDDMTEISQDEYDLQQEVNLRGAFFLAREAAEAMRRRGNGGRIINFTSQGWWTGGFGGSVLYAATKGGIVSMTRGMARTYGPHGILINCIAPGAVDTAMFSTDLSPQAYDDFIAQVPIGRIGQPEEVAAAAVFLASDHASFISGATLNVSGAQLMY